MNKRAKKILMDVIIFFSIAAFVIIFTITIADHQNMPYGNDWIMAPFSLITIFTVYFTISYSIVNISQKSEFSENRKILYGCLIMFFNVFIIPYFYIKHIRDRS